MSKLTQIQLDTIDSATLAILDLAALYRRTKDKDTKWALKLELIKLTTLLRQTLNNLED